MGVTEEMIVKQVHGFYGRVRTDDLLAPIFDRVIGDAWDSHLAKMCDFWSSVLLMTGRFKGSPMVAHARIDDLYPAHFARWLELFRQTAAVVCPLAAASLFIAKAELIAESLQLGAAARRGELPPTKSA
jgi:hemoglobin